MTNHNTPGAAGKERGDYIQLIADGEPYRLLFPVGAIIGILGVAMWPLFVWHAIKTYPGLAHPRIMIEGFLTCFVVGFLGTALPRLLDAPRMTLGEALGFAGALPGVAWLHFTGHTRAGDELFFLALLALACGFGFRAFFSRDIPPPSFILVGLGIASALAGAGIQIAAQLAPEAVPGVVINTGRLLLFQGYMLLPTMGVGAFLLPRFFGMPGRQNFPESTGIPPGWRMRALFAGMCGGMVLASFWIEACGWLRTGYALRAVAVICYLLREVPFHRAGAGGGTLAMGVRTALVSIPLGYLLAAALPERGVAFLHVVFITGFGLIAFTVATRVILGHSGQDRLFNATLRSLLATASLVAVAMLARVSADWMPMLRMNHYAYAALAWIAGVLIWCALILPGVRIGSPEE